MVSLPFPLLQVLYHNFCFLTDATIYVGGLDEKVNESLVWELFVQAGPVVNVHMPKDRVTLMHQVSSLTHFLQKYYIF